ncbi:hypothetical protein V8F20_012818 [Naviculisporaceae sp. PSN 640]
MHRQFTELRKRVSFSKQSKFHPSLHPTDVPGDLVRSAGAQEEQIDKKASEILERKEQSRFITRSPGSSRVKASERARRNGHQPRLSEGQTLVPGCLPRNVEPEKTVEKKQLFDKKSPDCPDPHWGPLVVTMNQQSRKKQRKIESGCKGHDPVDTGTPHRRVKEPDQQHFTVHVGELTPIGWRDRNALREYSRITSHTTNCQCLEPPTSSALS